MRRSPRNERTEFDQQEWLIYEGIIQIQEPPVALEGDALAIIFSTSDFSLKRPPGVSSTKLSRLQPKQFLNMMRIARCMISLATGALLEYC